MIAGSAGRTGGRMTQAANPSASRREEGANMPATNKTGTQLLLSPHVKTRGQALAVVRQEAVAEVWRILIEQALPGMESTHAGQLADLHEALDSMKVEYAEG